MTSKERVALALDHEQPDRVPIDYAARDEVTHALKRRLGVGTGEHVLERLGVDLRCVEPGFRGKGHNRYAADPVVDIRGDDLHVDIWGVGFRPSRSRGGPNLDLAHSPLAGLTSEADLDDYPWPTADMWHYADIAEQAKRHRNRWVWAQSRGMFEICWLLRGFHSFVEDLASRPGRACALMDRVMSYLVERAKRVLEAGRGQIDMIEYHDDLGGPNGLLIGPATWREHVKPRMGAFVRMCKGYGATVRYRSRGSVRSIIHDLIEMEVDVLGPLEAGAERMDPEELKQDFNEMITLNGGIDVPGLLLTAGRDEVRAEVRRLIDTLGHNGGYILAASDVLWPDVPIDNVLAVYEAALGREL